MQQQQQQQQQQQPQQQQTLLQQQQHQQQMRQTVQQQTQVPNIVTIQSGTTMTNQQLQQQLQLKQQQQQQQMNQQKYQQQQQQQQIQMQQQQQIKSQPQQIQLVTGNANNNQQFALTSQYQTNTSIQQQYNQQTNSITMATGASPMNFQANSPQQPPTPQQQQHQQQQQQSNQSSPSPNLKLTNPNHHHNHHHQSTLSPINQNILMGNNNSNLMTSPIKIEPSTTTHGSHVSGYQQNKIDGKTIVKTETDHQQTKRAGMQAIDNEYESEMGDLIGVDLAAEKKTLLASSTSGKVATNLDQIRACKDEKFLNIMILHKKFVDIGKKKKKKIRKKSKTNLGNFFNLKLSFFKPKNISLKTCQLMWQHWSLMPRKNTCETL
jgi:hypothetical protein